MALLLCSLRAVYGTDTKMNAVHASDSKETASRELAFFLPKLKIPYVPGTEPPIERTLALIRPHALAEHKGKYKWHSVYQLISLFIIWCFAPLYIESILQKIHEAGFEVAFQKELVLSKEQAEEFYKEHEDKEYFDSLTNHMSRYVRGIMLLHACQMALIMLLHVVQWANASLVFGTGRCYQWVEEGSWTQRNWGCCSKWTWIVSV